MRILPSGAVLAREVADLAEIEQPLVKAPPERHAPTIDIVRKMIDRREAMAARAAVHAVDEMKIDIVDRMAFLETIDQVERRTADALDGRQAQFHRTRGHFERLRTQFQRAAVGEVGVAHAKGQTAGAGPVLGREISGRALGLAIDDEIDAALAIEHDILGTVARHRGKAQALEDRFQHVRHGRSELHELEAHQPHRVVEQVCHGNSFRLGARRARWISAELGAHAHTPGFPALSRGRPAEGCRRRHPAAARAAHTAAQNRPPGSGAAGPRSCR